MNMSPTEPMPVLAAYALNGQQPRQVAQPTTIAEVATLVTEAASTHTAIVPWGAGSRQSVLDPPLRYDLALDLRRLDRLVEYQPADLVVMVEAGCALGTVQAILAQHGQWLPWDPPVPATATIGGLLATAAWGPLRLGYGSPREWLLGMQVVLGDGRMVRSGGRVVKNVAGYDTHKLHVGAGGTLGVIVAATFKVASLPERMASLQLTCPTLEAAFRAAVHIRQPPLQPVALTIRVTDTVILVARFAGVAAAVERQLALATAACAQVGDVTPITSDQALWQSLGLMPAADQILLRVGVPDGALELAAEAVQQVAPPDLAIFPGLGLIMARWPNIGADHVLRLRQTLTAAGGYAVVEHGPTGIDRWGPPPPTIDLMRALRQRWDPAGILNPGRWMVA
ncbi:MAG: FAD-binding oxidoreductase [Chloroflexus sp.]